MGTGSAYWWQQPYRTFQSNIREIDAGLDVKTVLNHIEDIGANSWLLNTGGIVSFYPSKLAFQHPSPWLSERASGDLIGDAVSAAHDRDVRLLSRIDFSKVHEDIAQEHPDWCFVSRTGELQIYNGLYSTCPSGPYYQECSFEILDEILGRYPVDGFFFNWFSFNIMDYSRRYHGVCHCVNCQRRYFDIYGERLPSGDDQSDPNFQQWRGFTEDTLNDIAARIRRFIKDRRPEVPLILTQDPDVVMFEANNAINRPQPLWTYGTGEFLRRTRTAVPDKPAWVNSVLFLDFPYRFTAEQPGALGAYFTQTLAHGGNMSAYVIGPPTLYASNTFDVVREVFRFQRDNVQYYQNMRSAARVAVVSTRAAASPYSTEPGVLTRDEHRGIFRALVEEHVPFDIIPVEKLSELGAAGKLDRYDALVLPNIAALDTDQSRILDEFVRGGGGLLTTYESATRDLDNGARVHPSLQSLGVAAVTARREDGDRVRSAYLREDTIADDGISRTGLILLDHGFLHVQPAAEATAQLRFVPPSRYGPPEKIYPDITETSHPGLVWHEFGAGRTAFVPWPVGALYEELNLPEHREVVRRTLTGVLGGPRQVETDAPPHVEVVVSAQEDSARTLVHLINYSGQRGRSFGAPLPIRDITVRLPYADAATRVRALKYGEDLGARATPDGVEFRLAELGLFELVVLEHGS